MSQSRAPGGTRAIVYNRVSHREQATLPDQERRCIAFAGSRDWEVVRTIDDRGISAWSGADRPGWLEVERMVEAGEVGAVVVFQVSRAARNTIRLAQFVARCREHDIVFAVCSEGIDSSTQMGRLMLTIIGALAELESEIRSERTQLGLDRVRAEGRWPGGRVPFGFRQEDGRLVVDEGEAALVREAAERFLAGTGLRTIAKDWHQREIPTKRGGKWSGTTIHDILADERHAGTTLLRSDHDRVVARLESGARRSTQRGDRYMLTGILRCGVCEREMVGQPKNGIRRYICLGGPHNTVIRGEDVEDYVTRRASEVTREVEGLPDPATLSGPLLADLERIENKLREWAVEAAAAGLPAGEIRAGRAPLVAERDRIAADLDAVAPKPHSSWGDLLNMPEPTAIEWRAYIEQVVDRVLIGPAKTNAGRAPSTGARIRIEWQAGVEEIDHRPWGAIEGEV